MKSVIQVTSIIIFLSYFQIATAGQYGDDPQRYGKDNSLFSATLPEIRIDLDNQFMYLGKIDFTIDTIAAGERYIFIDTSGNKVTRMFVAQFEGFLPSNSEIYRYSFKDPLIMGKHKFKQFTFAFSNREAKEYKPDGEAALTYQFIQSKGYDVEDQLMVSRFVTVPDEEKRHELILFYIENVSATGKTIEDFYNEDKETEIWKALSKGLTERSLESFKVVK